MVVLVPQPRCLQAVAGIGGAQSEGFVFAGHSAEHVSGKGSLSTSSGHAETVVEGIGALTPCAIAASNQIPICSA